MKKTMRSVVATLLILVMLFSVSVTTIFAAEPLSTGSGSTTSTRPPVDDSDDDSSIGSGNSLDLGWISVSYDDDSLDIVWHHWFSAMLETMKESPDSINLISEKIMEGIEHLVVDAIVNDFVGTGSGNSGAPSIDLNNIDTLWTIALNSYLENHPEYGTDTDVAVFAFFKDITDGKQDVADSFAAYVCDLLTAAVLAGIDIAELETNMPDESELKSKIFAIFEEKAEFVIHEVLEDYASVKKGEITYAPGSAKEFAYNEINLYVEKAVDNYVKALCGIQISDDDKTLLDGKFDAQLNSMLLTELSDEFDLIETYIRLGRPDGQEPLTYAIFAEMFKSLLNNGMELDDIDVTNIDLLVAEESNLLNINLVAENLTAGDYVTISSVLGTASDIISSLTKTEIEDIIGSVNLDEVSHLITLSLEDAVSANLQSFIHTVFLAYTERFSKLDEIGEFNLSKMLAEFLRTITINGKEICTYDAANDKANFQIDAIKALLAELPSATKLSDMTKEEMKLEYAVIIGTDFGSANFNVNISVGSNHANVRKFAKAVSELLTVERDDGKITVTLDLFDNIHGVLSDLASSQEISAELKLELFGLMDYTVEELYAYLSDDTKFTFEKFTAVVKAVDFESIFENFGITDVTNAKMVEFLCKDEVKFEETMAKLLSYFNSVPQDLRTKKLSDFYVGAGSFSYSDDISLSIGGVISKLGGFIPSEISSIITTALGSKTFSSSVTVNVNVPKLSKVTYVATHPTLLDSVTGEAVTVTKTGFLPEGISVQGFFAKTEAYGSEIIERYDGYRILKWSLTEGGEAVTEIPAGDVTLYATLEQIKVPVSIGTVYDDIANPDNKPYEEGIEFDKDQSYTLDASVVYSYNTQNPSFTYKWFKNNVEISGETAATLALAGNVLDSGEYYCEVTINDGPFVDLVVYSEKTTIVISPRKVNINDYGFEWHYPGPFNYDEKWYNVSLTLESLYSALAKNSEDLPAIEADPRGLYAGNEGKNAGKYLAQARFVVKATADQIPSNYVFVDENGNATTYHKCEWEILPKKVDFTEVEYDWYLNGAKLESTDSVKATYVYGTRHSVTIALPEYLKVLTYIDNQATAAGTRTAKAQIGPANTNYEWASGAEYEEATLSWTVERALFDLAGVTWSYNAEAPFVYNGAEQKVLIVGVPEDIVFIYTDNAKTNAGEYVAKAEYDPNHANNLNYVFKGSISDCPFTIGKKIITTETLEKLEWNYTEAFTYEFGKTYSVELNVPADLAAAGIVVNYENNASSNAGNFKATAKLEAFDPVNFEVVGDAEKLSYALDWTINKAVADMSGISFKNKTVYYNGAKHSIEIVGTLPAGISVEYSEAKIEVGVYEMTATFVYNASNFETIAPMTATLTIRPVYPPKYNFSYEDSNGNILVDINAKLGVPSNYVLNTKDTSTQYYGYDFGDTFGEGKNGKIISVYDIHFTEDGVETPISNSSFTVKILLPKNFDGDINNVRVVYIAENGEVTDMEAMPDGDYLAFETTHFSVYGIVEIVDRVEKDSGFKLYDLIPYGIAVLVLIVLLIIIIVIIKKKRKKNKPEDPEAKEEPTPDEPAPETEAEEADVEVAPEEEAPVEEKPTIVIHESVEDIPVEESINEENEDAPKTSEIVHVRCRSSFMSRLIQSEPPIQDYYTVLKNALLSYKGVKARMSFNFESFNSGRVQCAKLNVKGKSFLVYLGLDLEEYNVNKYHFTDASDKPKFEKVPMMLKVKSDRSLKYALELIDEVMKKNGFEKDSKFVEADYHMPYETTAALAEKELVKLILPQGVSLAEGIKLVKADVGAIIDEANAKSSEDDED